MFCVTINIMLKGRKMTDLTEYIESPDEGKNKSNQFYNGVNLAAMESHYRNINGITSF